MPLHEAVYRILYEAEFVQVTTELVASLTKMANLPNVGGTALGIARLFTPRGEGMNPLRLAFGSDKAVYAAASPINHIRKDLPPMLLLYAGLEIPPLGDQAVEYAEKLKMAGVDVTLEKMPRADHNTIVFGIGPAGTGKTYLAMAKAVQALQRKEVSRIILTRPAVEAGERLG